MARIGKAPAAVLGFNWDPALFLTQESDEAGGTRVAFDRGRFFRTVVGHDPRDPGDTVALAVDGGDRHLTVSWDGGDREPALGDAEVARVPARASIIGVVEAGDARAEQAIWNEMWERVSPHVDQQLLGFALGSDAARAANAYNVACTSIRFGQLARAVPVLAHLVFEFEQLGMLPGATVDTDGLLAKPHGEIARGLFAAASSRELGRLPQGVDARPQELSSPSLKRWLKVAPLDPDPRHSLTPARAMAICSSLAHGADGAGLDVNGLGKLGQDVRLWRLFHCAAEMSSILASSVLRDPKAALRAVEAYGSRGPRRAPEEGAPVSLPAVPEATLRSLLDDRAFFDFVLAATQGWLDQPGLDDAERIRRRGLGFVRQNEEAEEWHRIARTTETQELQAARDGRRNRRLNAMRAGRDRANENGPARRQPRVYEANIPPDLPFPTPISPIEFAVVAAERHFTARWLNDRGALQRESEVMDNCIGRFIIYSQRCLAGESICYTFLDDETGRTAATLELSADLDVIQIQGPRNSPAPIGLRGVIERTLAPFQELANEAHVAAQQANQQVLEAERERAVELQVARAEIDRGRQVQAEELAQVFRF